MVRLTGDTGSHAASARPTAANIETVTASISACRPVNIFGFANLIFDLPNPD
jgi:hypothetical protein